jgi:hypothetical protein
MTLPPDTDKRIAKAEGWRFDKKQQYGLDHDNTFGAWVGPNGEVREWNKLPSYTTDPAAILPVLTKRCPGFSINHNENWEVDRWPAEFEVVPDPAYTEGVYGSTICEAACAAVLAQLDAGAGDVDREAE